jgi:hypothetical protein
MFAMIESEAKELLTAALKELGIDEATIHAVWLTRDGYVIGRRFECGPACAVWLFDENEVKVYDQDGKLLKIDALDAKGTAA